MANEFIKDRITYYVLEKFVGVWTPDGYEMDDYEEAKQELEFYKKHFPEHEWRLRKKTSTVIWRRA